MNSRGNNSSNTRSSGRSNSSNQARPPATVSNPQMNHGHALAPRDQAELDFFRAALKELTFNSRPVIEKLTAMARERARTIPGPISRTILDNLVFNNPNYRSCFLFLIDSIIKTVGEPYPTSFVKHGLVSAYFRVFGEICAAGDEQQKKDFLRVLPTWNGVIAPEALREIESKVAVITGTPINITTAPVARPTAPVARSTEPATQRNTRTRFSPQTMKLLTDLQAVFVNPPGPRISGIVSEIFKRLARKGEVPREVLGELDFKAKQADKRVIIETLAKLIKDNAIDIKSIPTVLKSVNPPPAASETAEIPLNFELPPDFQIDFSVLSSIVELNKLNSSPSSSIPASPSKPIVANDKHFIEIPVTSADLLISRPNLFKVLYDDLPLHCKTCGIRFRDTELGRKRMTVHLDSHFRRNMRLKEKSKRVLARDLFGSEEDWISAKEDSEKSSERTVNVFEDSSSSAPKDEEEIDSFVEATEEEQSSQIKCSTCQETISVIWNDEREKWIFPACARNEFDQIIHVTCQTSENEPKRTKIK